MCKGRGKCVFKLDCQHMNKVFNKSYIRFVQFRSLSMRPALFLLCGLGEINQSDFEMKSINKILSFFN